MHHAEIERRGIISENRPTQSLRHERRRHLTAAVDRRLLMERSTLQEFESLCYRWGLYYNANYVLLFRNMAFWAHPIGDSSIGLNPAQNILVLVDARQHFASGG